MKIVRNDVTYELTNSEKYAAYRECKRELLIEDIKAKAIEMNIDFDEIDIENIADKAERGLDNNDSYFESYWMSLEYAFE